MKPRVAFVVLALGAAATDARAEGDVGALSPRAVGHAGAALVSDDGPAALFACPAAIARRGGRRVQVAGLVVDDDVWLAVGDGHPRIGDRGPAERLPLAGAVVEAGPVIVGVALATTESIDRRLPAPEAALPPATVTADFPHRYASLELRHARRALAVGAAVRATDWLALGVTVTAARVETREARRIWAGFGGRDPLGDPQRDVTVELGGTDGFVPGAAAGALVAPAAVPLELALGASWSADVTARGEVSAASVRTPPIVTRVAPGATRTTTAPLVLHAGVRWVGARYALEGGATAWAYRRAPAGAGRAPDGAWQLDGLRLVDDSGATATVPYLASRAGRRTHAALRASADVEVLPGFLWLAAGYAWRGAGQSQLHTTLGGLDHGGHTLALGVELTAGAAAITAGWSRQLARARTIDVPALPYDDPFAGGALPANRGAHGQARDHVGLGLELTFD